MIGDVAAFRAAVRRAAASAGRGRLVTFGIAPDRPHTGYGYIRIGEALPQLPGTFAVERFVEKPSRELAERYLAEGDHVWNSGIFLFPARLFLDELTRFEPTLLDACRAALDGLARDLDFRRLDATAFRRLPSVSVDVAVMERTDRSAVVPVEMGWSDLGNWQALWESGAKDGHGNVRLGDTILHGTEGSYVRSENGRLVAVVGMEDVAVVATEDAVLVAPKGREEGVGEVLRQLAAEGRPEPTFHKTVHRPWGSYRNLDEGNRFRVKQIVVKPGGRLSLQYHSHRAEHWVVVQGTARVTCGDRIFVLHENESTFIPIGTVHRLENPGKIPLRLIEVQSGAYLEEDDIVRVEDEYRRG
jgi:mannose-1-phosphate guanylyltransferase / mannose-6-phosphate isomerase